MFAEHIRMRRANAPIRRSQESSQHARRQRLNCDERRNGGGTHAVAGCYGKWVIRHSDRGNAANYPCVGLNAQAGGQSGGAEGSWLLPRIINESNMIFK